MIVYNLPYRGAFEYDKLVLNALSFHNHIQYTRQQLDEAVTDTEIVAMPLDTAQELVDQAYLRSLSTF